MEIDLVSDEADCLAFGSFENNVKSLAAYAEANDAEDMTANDAALLTIASSINFLALAIFQAAKIKA